MKTLVVFGTRPEAIKMCPLVNALKKVPEFEVVTCVTGQHREMLDQVLKVFSIEPDVDLNIMKQGQSLHEITSSVLAQIANVIDSCNPDIILVHGDTTTSFAASLAAFYSQKPIGHVEAGLRTGNMSSPYPEEFNRQAVDLITSYYFAPTNTARKNLLLEGKRPDHIWVTGNTGIDALRTTVREDYRHEELEWASESRLVLITAHRRENLGQPMHHMFRAVRRLVESHSDVKAIYPVHLNPTVRRIANEELNSCQAVHLIEPLDVLAFHNIMARCHLILTDSGGIQEEAPALGKPVLVMRDTTERPEGVEAGTLKLVGTDEHTIFDECSNLLNDPIAYSNMAKASNPYGDGFASDRIVKILHSQIN